MLITRSIKAPIAIEDDLRICIMRSVDQEKHPEYKPFDELWEELAPSNRLLKDYLNGLPWVDYVQRFTSEVLAWKQNVIIKLAKMALVQNVTILCVEPVPDTCHRRLVALACKMYFPELELKLE